MADGLSVTIDDREIHQMIERKLRLIDKPERLLKDIGRLIRAWTTDMLNDGKPRPDNRPVRGVTWPKLSESTIKRKKAAINSGRAVGGALRPLVFTGKMRDSLNAPRALKVKGKGLEYGTEVRSKKGFPYPGAHNAGEGVPQRRWLFLNTDNLNQIAHMTRDFLLERLRLK